MLPESAHNIAIRMYGVNTYFYLQNALKQFDPQLDITFNSTKETFTILNSSDYDVQTLSKTFKDHAYIPYEPEFLLSDDQQNKTFKLNPVDIYQQIKDLVVECFENIQR